MYHIRYIDDLRWTINCIHKLFNVHKTSKSPERLDFFRKFALFTEIFFKAMTTTYISFIFVFPGYLVYVYLVKGEWVPVLPIYIPGVDESTLTGYMILVAFQIIVVPLATIGLVAVEFLISILIIGSLIFAKLISLDLHQINIDLVEGSSGMLAARARLRNIFLMHQEMDE